MLGLPVVLANRARLLSNCCVALILAGACAVFPDQAVLPGTIAVGATAGEPSAVDGEAGAAGRADVSPMGGVGAGGAPAPVDSAGDGGEDVLSSAGAGGAAPECPR